MLDLIILAVCTFVLGFAIGKLVRLAKEGKLFAEKKDDAD